MFDWRSCVLRTLALTGLMASQATLQAAEDDPARPAVPVHNYSGISGIGAYVARQASEAQYALFQRDSGLAVLAEANTFSKDGMFFCVGQVGLTHLADGNKATPRSPVTRYYGGSSDTSLDETQCKVRAVTRALDKLLSESVPNLTDGLEQTQFRGGQRPAEKPDLERQHSYFRGMNAAGSRYIFNATPDWMHRAFDYRTVAFVKALIRVDADSGQLICMGSLGMTSRAPDGRQNRVPLAESAKARLFSSRDREKSGQDAECFDLVFDALANEGLQPDSELVTAFLRTWPQVAEPDLKAPTKKDVTTAVAWQTARDRKVAAAERAEATRVSQRVAQQTTCTVDCVNGACIRRWPDGRSERFQAPRKFNPFTSQWEWDTSGC